jgi:predicted ABC-type ATPase
VTERPQLIMLAGPNGAGKSTYYGRFLADSPLPFLNADVFSARAGIDSFEAARALDAERTAMVERGEGFITETVFSDPLGEKLELLRRAIAGGFEVTLIYIGIDAYLSAFRIDDRVAAGGHDVPRDKLAGRYERSLANLRTALTFVPIVRLYDNSSIESAHRLLAVFEAGKRTYLAPGPLPPWATSVMPPAPRRTKKLLE